MTNKTKLLLAIFLIVLGVLGRVLPHAWNFAPIIAIGLFAGTYLGARYAFFVPLFAMIVSDMFLGFYDWKVNVSVYIAMAFSGLVGLFLQRKKNIFTVTLASITASTFFFIISNGAVWYFGTMYSHAFKGLIDSLNAGIPFFRSALRGDLWYSFVLFGTYELVKLYFSIVSKRTAKSFAINNKSLLS